jgi:hypothetical protein
LLRSQLPLRLQKLRWQQPAVPASRYRVQLCDQHPKPPHSLSEPFPEVMKNCPSTSHFAKLQIDSSLQDIHRPQQAVHQQVPFGSTPEKTVVRCVVPSGATQEKTAVRCAAKAMDMGKVSHFYKMNF